MTTGRDSMKLTIKFLELAFLVTVATAMGCDQSKAELDSTKQQLQAVTTERDGLKTQLDTAKQQTAALQAQVADLQTKVATAAAAPADDKKEEAHAEKKP